jgi:Fe(3+) dicitrate transport protein
MSHALQFPRSAIAVACSLLISNAALAQASAGNATAASDASLETVQVTGNWLGSGQKSVKTFGGARTVVKREEIQDSGASSISDVLRAVPGVQVTDNSSSGGSAISLNIGVRGLDGRFSPRSTVLLDGVPLAVAPYGQPQLSFAPVSLANLESIDVIRGGGAVRYGPQNVGGIINFKTRAIPDSDIAGDASVRVNKYDGGNTSTQYSAFVGGRIDGGLGVALLYSGIDGNGYRQRSSDKINDVALKFSYPLSAGAELYAKFSYYDARANIPGGLTAAQYAADTKASFRSYDYWNGQRTGYDIGYVNTISDTREVEVRAYFNDSKRKSLLANGQDGAVTSFSYQPRQYKVLGVEPRITQRLVLGQVRNDITAGYRYMNERSDELNDSIKFSDGSLTVVRSSHATTQAHAVYIDDQIAYDKWRITPGVRYERIDLERLNQLTGFVSEDKNSKALPSLNVAYLLNRDLTVFGNYTTSFGSIQHLQLNLQASTDSLQPETARTTELGARYAGRQWQLEATVFNLDFSNQIVFVNTAPLFYKNLGKTLHRGIETRAEYSFDQRSMLAGLNAYATYAYTKAEQRQGANAGKDVPFYSRNVNTEGLRYKLGGWRFDVNTTYQSRQYADDINTEIENAAGSIGAIAGYRLWNANVSWTIPGQQRWELQAGVNNLTNKATFSRTTDTNLGKLPGASRMVFAQVRTGF